MDLAKKMSKSDIERIFFHLVTIRILQEYSIMNNGGFAASYVKVGPNSKKLLDGKLDVAMQFTSSSSAGTRTPSSNEASRPSPSRMSSSRSEQMVPKPAFISAKQLSSFSYRGNNAEVARPISLQNNTESRSTQELIDITAAYNKLREVSLGLGNRMNPPVMNFLSDVALKKLATILPVTPEQFSSIPSIGERQRKKFKYFKSTILNLRKNRRNISNNKDSIVLSNGSSIPELNSQNSSGTKSHYFSLDPDEEQYNQAIVNQLRDAQFKSASNSAESTQDRKSVV